MGLGHSTTPPSPPICFNGFMIINPQRLETLQLILDANEYCLKEYTWLHNSEDLDPHCDLFPQREDDLCSPQDHYQ